MPGRPKKQVVLFIVEGSTDIETLSFYLEDLIGRINPDLKVFFTTLSDDSHPYGGDVTTRNGVNQYNILGVIGKLATEYCNTQKFYPKEICAIIQIADIDGAYIPDSSIYKTNPVGDKKTFYYEDCIKTSVVSEIIERNQRKRENLETLINAETIKLDSRTIDYSIYYFSCNLECYLYNERNMKQEDKGTKAKNFSVSCFDDSGYFDKAMKSGESAISDMSYKESWDFLKEGLNSLGRYSNLGILLKQLEEGRIKRN